MISRIFLAYNAISIGLIGLLYLLDPNILLARYELDVGSVGMDNMLRSTYGGLFLGSALLFSIGIFKPLRQKDALGFVGVFMTGLAIGRIASITAAGMPASSIVALLVFEAITAGLAWFLYTRA